MLQTLRPGITLALLAFLAGCQGTENSVPINGSSEAPNFAVTSVTQGSIANGGTYNYGDPGIDTSEQFTITNIGNSETSVLFEVALANSTEFFLVSDNCSGMVIPVNGSCQFEVTYFDMGPGTFTDILTISDSTFDITNFILNLEGH